MPTAAAVGRVADATATPRQRTNGATALETKREPAKAGLAPIFEAFAAAGLPRPMMPPQEARAANALLKIATAEAVARCWQEYESGEYGDRWDREHLSFAHLLSRNRLLNWQRERGGSDAEYEEQQRQIVGRVQVRRF